MEKKDVVWMEAGPSSSHIRNEKYKIIRTAMDSGYIDLPGRTSS